MFVLNRSYASSLVQVIVADCIPIMQKYISDGKMFDYIVNDLTAIPITTEPRGRWFYCKTICELFVSMLYSGTPL